MIEDEINEVVLTENNGFIIDQINYINGKWGEVEDNFLIELGKFYKKELESPKLKCYLIRLDTFPYDYTLGNESWFSAPLFGNPAERNRVIMHELCHYFQPTELPKHIKESLPVILNDHDIFKMYSNDKGHQDDAEEQKWRKIVWSIYKNGGNFDDLLSQVKN
jgi:hypothetical protein